MPDDDDIIEITLRGQKVRITDVSAFEDRSVGIWWHVEDLIIRDLEGNELNWYEDLSDAEWEQINDAVWNAQQKYENDWPERPDDEEVH